MDTPSAPTPFEVTSRHIGVAAEAAAAALFARAGFDVSVQYGANQPEYDLIVARPLVGVMPRYGNRRS